jgi:hypothetical protein
MPENYLLTRHPEKVCYNIVMRPSKRGIVIVSILVLTLLATFFLGALVQMNPGRLRRNLHDENRDRAALAAKAGVDYALNRFKSNTDWKADANTKTVEMDDLVILEDNGNVLGWIKTEDGAWAGFRLRFNAQDGSGGRDGWNDPQYPISTRSISLNNLTGSNDKPVPLANASYSAPLDFEETSMTAPPNSLALLVEGIVDGDLDPSDPSGLAQASGGTTRTVEGIFVVSDILAGTDGDAVLMAGGDVTIEVGDKPRANETAAARDTRGVLSLQSGSDNVAGIRTKKKLELKRGQGGSSSSKFDPDEDATVHVNPMTPFSETLADGTTFQGGEEDADAAFQKIEWEKLKDSEQSDAVSLPGGVYIFTDGDADSGRSPSRNVKFFDMTWNEYRTALIDPSTPPPAESPVPQDFLDMVELDAKDVTLTKEVDGQVVEYQEKRDIIKVTGDVSIDDPNGKGLTIVPERGARQKAGSDGEPAPIEATTFLDLGDSVRIETSSQIMAEMTKVLTSGNRTNMNLSVDVGTGFENLQYQGALPYGGLDFYNGGNPGPGVNLIGQVALGNGQFQIQSGSLTAAQDFAGVDITPVPPPVPNAPVMQYNVEVTDPTAFLSSLFNGNPPQVIIGGGGTVDPLHIPNVDPETGEPISDDKTVPQDIELVFEPAPGKDSAFIRSESDIFLGTHLSGKGGGVISNAEVNLVGFGVNLNAKLEQNLDERQERTGVAIYGKEGINISTFDERRHKYWDVEVKGAVFTEGNISLRLGEEPLSTGEDPTWGAFDYEGSMIALGDGTPTVDTDLDSNFTNTGNMLDSGDDSDDGSGDNPTDAITGGKADIIARGVRLYYDPRYLAPYVEANQINPTFTALSVVER